MNDTCCERDGLFDRKIGGGGGGERIFFSLYQGVCLTLFQKMVEKIYIYIYNTSAVKTNMGS